MRGRQQTGRPAKDGMTVSIVVFTPWLASEQLNSSCVIQHVVLLCVKSRKKKEDLLSRSIFQVSND